MDILKIITDAQIASAAVYPTSPYTGSLPEKTVRKGSEGSDVKAVQKFLNWCIKAGLKVDGSCGKNTVSAIKKYQKQYKLKVDGVFGSQSKRKAKDIIAKYAPKPIPAPTPTPVTWVEKANAWAKMIAADNDFHYVKWSANDKNTHSCPICSERITLKTAWDAIKHVFNVLTKKINSKKKYIGWNCIGFAYAVWHHGGGLKNHCNCHVIANDIGNKMYKSSTADALKIAKKYIGLDDIKVIKNKKGIPKSEWKAGDICMKFSGSKYTHTFYYMGNGKIADSTGSSGKVPNDKQIAVRDYKKYSAKIIIRYIGK